MTLIRSKDTKKPFEPGELIDDMGAFPHRYIGSYAVVAKCGDFITVKSASCYKSFNTKNIAPSVERQERFLQIEWEINSIERKYSAAMNWDELYVPKSYIGADISEMYVNVLDLIDWANGG